MRGRRNAVVLLSAVIVSSWLMAAGCGSTTAVGSRSNRTSSTAAKAGPAKASPAAGGASVTSAAGSFQTVIPPGFLDGTRSVPIHVANLQYLAVGPRSHAFATNINVIRESARGRTGIDQIVGMELATIKRLEPRASGFSPVSGMTIGGDRARVVDYINRSSGGPLLHQRQAFVVHDGWIYTITLSALPSTYAANLGALNRVAAAWRWT
jgi:hypothetical protein